MAQKTRTDHKNELIRTTFLTDSGKKLLELWKKEFIDVSCFDESEVLMARATTFKDFVQQIIDALDVKVARGSISVVVDNSKDKDSPK